MQFVEVVLTDDQALLLSQAADFTAKEGAAQELLGDGEEDDLKRLTVFLHAVSEAPHAFPPSGKMVVKLRRKFRALKGPAQPQPRGKNKRKARQEARQGAAKRRRKERAANVRAWNGAVARAEAEKVELAEIAAAENARRKERLEYLTRADTLRAEEVHELLDLTGVASLAEYARKQREAA